MWFYLKLLIINPKVKFKVIFVWNQCPETVILSGNMMARFHLACDQWQLSTGAEINCLLSIFSLQVELVFLVSVHRHVCVQRMELNCEVPRHLNCVIKVWQAHPLTTGISLVRSDKYTKLVKEESSTQNIWCTLYCVNEIIIYKKTEWLWELWRGEQFTHSISN